MVGWKVFDEQGVCVCVIIRKQKSQQNTTQPNQTKLYRCAWRERERERHLGKAMPLYISGMACLSSSHLIGEMGGRQEGRTRDQQKHKMANAQALFHSHSIASHKPLCISGWIIFRGKICPRFYTKEHLHHCLKYCITIGNIVNLHLGHCKSITYSIPCGETGFNQPQGQCLFTVWVLISLPVTAAPMIQGYDPCRLQCH